MANTIHIGLSQFQTHYAHQFGPVEIEVLKNRGGIKHQYCVKSPKMREGNDPCIFHHNRKTDHVIVLIHGLTDSPYYMKAIAKEFHSIGLNVVLPLLPGHGLKNPEPSINANDLAKQWRQEIDQAVQVASLLGKTISIGGLSAGGCLSLNKALRHPEAIAGGIFLFSAALDIGKRSERIGQLIFNTVGTVGKIEGLVEKIGSGLRWVSQNPTKPLAPPQQISSRFFFWFRCRTGIAQSSDWNGQKRHGTDDQRA